MSADQDVLVNVQGAWNGWRTAEVRLSGLEQIHWLQPSGAPRPLLHGYVSCNAMVSGNIPHECSDTPGPHRFLICVLKQHNTAALYAELAARATPPPIHLQTATPARVGL